MGPRELLLREALASQLTCDALSGVVLLLGPILLYSEAVHRNTHLRFREWSSLVLYTVVSYGSFACGRPGVGKTGERTGAVPLESLQRLMSGMFFPSLAILGEVVVVSPFPAWQSHGEQVWFN